MVVDGSTGEAANTAERWILAISENQEGRGTWGLRQLSLRLQLSS